MKRAITSASNIFRRRLCPGSARMEAPFGETDSEYSAEGTMLHKLFLTGQRPDTLTPEQAQTLDLADFYAEEFFANIRQQFGIARKAEFFDERDCGMILHDLDRTPLFPGHADVIRNWPQYQARAIVDAKMGFMEVDAAADNLQLASYFAMREQQATAGGFGSSTSTGIAIVQPRNFGPRMTQAIYAGASLAGVITELAGIVYASEQPDAPLNAGDHCHFCKAKVLCQAYKAKFEGQLAVMAVMPIAVQSLPAADLERLHIAIAFANKIKKEVTDEVRARTERGEFPGYKLQNSGDDVTLNDALGFFSALQSAMPEGTALTASEFDRCRDVVWGELTALIQIKLKVSENRAKEIIRAVSEPYATRTPKAMRVVRDKSRLSIE